LEVLLDPAGEMAQASVVGDRVDRVGYALDEVAVVAGDHERAGPAVEQVLERRERVDVKVVGWLIEQQDVRSCHQQPHHLQAAALSAGHVRHEDPGPVAAKAEALAERAGGQLAPVTERGGPAHLLERLQDSQVTGDLRGVLGEVRQAHRRATLDLAPGGIELTSEQLQQRCLTRAIGAQQRHPIAWSEAQCHGAQDFVCAKRAGHVHRLQHLVAQTGAREPRELRAVAHLGFVRNQCIRGFQPELRLRRPRGRTTP
jgi:hypothetical protein